MVEALQADLYGPDGSRKGSTDLDPAVFGIEPNGGVMHQVVTAQLAAARAGTHSTLRRGEVRGGGRKPWRQKGIGRARHGSIRSPQWVGGGVAHGPKPRSYRQRVNKKVRRLALRSALSTRAASGDVKVVERFDWETPKTRQGKEFLALIGATGKTLVVLGPADRTPMLAFRNLTDVSVCPAGQLNTRDILWADTVVFTLDTLEGVGGRRGGYDVSDSDFVREDAAPAAAADAEVADAGPANDGKEGEAA